MTERLAQLEQKKAALDKQIRLEHSRQKTKERKEDTRRKILAGAIALTHAEQDAQFRAYFYALLDRFLVPARDRAVRGLGPVTPPPTQTPANDTPPLDTVGLLFPASPLLGSRLAEYHEATTTHDTAP